MYLTGARKKRKLEKLKALLKIEDKKAPFSDRVLSLILILTAKQVWKLRTGANIPDSRSRNRKVDANKV